MGTPPGAATRVIRVGLDMLRNERVATGADGRTQMLFLDGSALTVGPNSEITLDEFVFEPGTGKGKLALSASRGLLRFVGGKISKGSPVEIRTPSATIGVRGGIALVEVGATTRAQFLFGDQMTVSSAGVTREVSRPGFEVTAARGAAPSAPAAVSEAGVARNLGGLEGVSGSTGGAPKPPTDENVAGTQIAQLGSGSAPMRIAARRRAAGPGPGGPAPLPAPPVEREPAQASQISTIQQAATGLDSPFTYGGRDYSNKPFTSFDLATLTAIRDPNDNAAYSGARIQGGFLVGQVGGDLVRLPVRLGEFAFGAVGQVDGDIVSGRGFLSSDLAFFHFVGKSEIDGERGAIFGGVPFDPPPAPTGFAAYALKPGYPGGDHIPFLPFELGGDFGGASVSPLLARFFEPSVPPPANARMVALYGAIALDGQGPGQRSAMATYTGGFFEDPGLGKDVLAGFAEASVRPSASALPVRVSQGGTSAADPFGNSFFGLSGPDYFVLDSDFYPPGANTSRQPAVGIKQTFENPAGAAPFYQTQYAARRPVPAGIGASRTSRGLNGYVGAIADVRTGFVAGIPQFDVANYGNFTPAGVQIVTDAAANRAAASFALGEVFNSFPTAMLMFGGLSGPGARSAFIEDRIFGMRDSTSPGWLGNEPAEASGGLLTSAFFTNQSAVPAGVTLCACAHLVWGFFSADLREADGGPLRARFHLAPFVAGALPDPADIPSAGDASYSGHVAANVINAGARYVAFGNFSQTWSFGSRTGAVSLSNLDGANYTGSITSQNGREFVGAIAGAGRSGVLNGSFFRGAGGDPAAASAGRFHVEAASGPDYEIGGVFAAQKQ